MFGASCFPRLEEQCDCQQTLHDLVPMWGPVLWQKFLIQLQRLKSQEPSLCGRDGKCDPVSSEILTVPSVPVGPGFRGGM